MTSQIVRTNPTAGTATTSSVRNNFGFAADEINRLLRANTDKVVATGTDSVVANFSNVPTFVLVDGVRVLIQIATTTTSATPTLNVNNTSNVPIKKSDNTDLAIGDLVAGGYYEFVYSSLNNYWLVLNLPSPFSSQNKLFEAMLGGLYPVGGLLTTTNSANPGDADYFFSGITFGTWEAYAQGRVLVGVSPSATIDGGGISSDIATITTNEPHNLLVNSRVTIQNVTGITNPNGVHFVKYVNSPTSFSFELVGGDETFTNISATSLAINTDFSSTGGNLGGESSHTSTKEEMQHIHATGTFSATSNDVYYPILSLRNDTSYPNVPADTFPTGLGDHTINLRWIDGEGESALYANKTIGKDDSTSTQTAPLYQDSHVASTPHNNLQPYITTYIWKRTA